MSIQRLLGKIRNSFLRLGQAIARWFSRFVYGRIRTLLGSKRRPQAGFVLPTVTMVMLVVSLLTLAMLLRSTDRAKNAHNFRVNEATLNAAAPALDRARAKIDKLFSDPSLSGRGTPSDDSLINAISTAIGNYTFGDETALTLIYDVDEQDGAGQSDTDGDDDFNSGNISRSRPETLTSAWKFPIDTDNDGLFDTFTLYGIYLANSPGEDERPRYPLEARTPPLSEGQKPGKCQSSVVTSANKVGTSGWLKIDDKLKKSVYVYATNVPITSLTNLNAADYETFEGAGGFSAIEYQQDRSRIPLANNAVVYEDDLRIMPGAGIELNGRILTNGNLLTGDNGEDVRFWLVSSPESCFYEEEASKILVGGNLANGRVTDTSDKKNALLDLFQGKATTPKKKQNLGKSQKSITAKGGQAVYNNTFAYQERVDYLVDAAIAAGGGTGAYTDNGKSAEEYRIETYPTDVIPQEIINSAQSRIQANGDLDLVETIQEELQIYFRQRTRRVPYAEVPAGENAVFIGSTAYNDSSIDSQGKAKTFFTLDRFGSDVDKTGLSPLRPPNSWMYPVNPDDNSTTYMKAKDGSSELKLDIDKPPASDPSLREGKEYLQGDRVLLGNNLPEYVYNPATQEFVQNGEQDLQKKDNKWFETNGNDTTDNIRTRTSQVTTLAQPGATERDGFWELSAAEEPEDPRIETVGGLRVVTGAGLYLPKASDGSLPSFPGTIPDPEAWPLDYTAWPDWMPVPHEHYDSSDNPIVYDELGKPIGGKSTSSKLGDSKHPYLVMRATAVYHYDKNPTGDKGDPYDPNETKTPDRYQTPIACISSYYDPTDETSAKDVSAGGNSNNGIVYKWPGDQWKNYLSYQAKLRFPNGNWVNPILHDIDKDNPNGSKKINLTSGALESGKSLTLSERTAIDTAMCAYSIFKNPGSNKDQSLIDNDTIKETTFLDAREIKAIEAIEATIPTTAPDIYEPSNYDRPIEERQPLEIRATVLDLDKMRKKTFGSASPTQEYIFPNSGIIYATREDAVRDNSVPGQAEQSSKDSVLDPYRHPNGIMLTNGSNLRRETDYRLEERGLILATNSSVYVKGEFNLHTKGGEFKNETTHLDYSRKNADLNPNFACRKGQFAECTEGDDWRPATVIADAVMLLSSNFNEGYRTDGDYDLRFNFDDPAHWWKDGDAYKYSIVKPSNNIAPVGFDADGNGTINENTKVSETSLTNLTAGIRAAFGSDNTDSSSPNRTDLNLDGDADDNEVKETDISAATVARAIRRLNGFWDNNFVTSRAFTDSDYSDKNKKPDPSFSGHSSYFNNFVTPIQRRVEFPEYLMEMCPKLPVSACGPDDWYIIGYDANSPGSPGDAIGDGDTDDTFKESDIPVYFNPDNDLDDTIQEYVSYDLNGDGTLDSTTALNEAKLAIDLDGDNATTTTDKFEGILGIDLNGDGTVDSNADIAESSIKLDIDGDGDIEDKDLTEKSWGSGLDLNGDGEIKDDVKITEDNIPLIDWNGDGDYLDGFKEDGTDSGLFDVNADGEVNDETVKESDIKFHVSDLIYSGMTLDLNRIGTNSGTTSRPPSDAAYQQFPRRVAFLRDRNNTLRLDNNTPIVFAIDHQNDSNDTNDIVNYAGYSNFDVPTVEGKFASHILGTNFLGVIETLMGESLRGTHTVNTDSLDANNRKRSNTLWFKTTTNSGDPTSGDYYGTGSSARGLFYINALKGTIPGEQPLLVPLLQLQVTTNTPSDTNDFTSNNIGGKSNTQSQKINWMLPAGANTQYNLVMATGDIPGRPQDNNGGFGNFPRFLENWGQGSDQKTVTILGSFIQLVRSSYANASFFPYIPNSQDGITYGGIEDRDGTLFGYTQAYSTGNNVIKNNKGRLPYYFAPKRAWGFDVALLTQQPDLFSQQFTTPPTADPNEFFRQVSRDDDWVKTLLCAAQETGGFDNADAGYGSNYTYAIPQDQRPSTCPVKPN
ncbi:hormogonium polysaccharide biosynthesis protein HpsA [Roseofilum casamattae]|uniref:Hormogonium polysaccharide biosynthesis protein HpsA n=1 Tax=Roseofilum casamattae BLCC-M143 TaxID=3022442 RepID=A0ABT7C2L9_9CYAN|nr:hormogonium polysaccharide biosynthesis protein HpsA [Roseofilum casamattae]MDJ1184984.1 hormogonium polysaccharide biosynthesis protein HpsA [Roseofilum casamattae BLCC-M143]